MLDRNLIGHSFGKRSLVVEEGAVRSYAQAIGETDATCFDPSAARAAGHRALRVPPTFLSCLEGRLFPTRALLGLGIGGHGGDGWDLLRAVCGARCRTPCAARSAHLPVMSGRASVPDARAAGAGPPRPPAPAAPGAVLP